MVRVIFAVLLLSGTIAWGQESEGKTGQKPLKIEPRDLKNYMDFVRARAPKMTDPVELELLTRTSFERIYMHQLRSNFHSKPSPGRVMEKIEEIFHEFDKAQHTLRNLRGNRELAVSPHDMDQVMDQLDHSARSIQSDFQEYFTELNRGTLNIQIPQLGADAREWRFYLVRVDQCFSILHEQLQQYFFSSQPGRVEVQEYTNPGIVTITKAIRQLTRIYRNRLRVR